MEMLCPPKVVQFNTLIENLLSLIYYIVNIQMNSAFLRLHHVLQT